MFQGIILYLIMVIGAFIGWILVPMYPFFLFFMMLMILFVIDIIFSLLTMKKATITYSLEKEVLIRNQNAIMHLTRNPNQRFPVGKIICECYHGIGEEKKKYQIHNTSLHQKEKMPVSHCGIYTFTIYNEYYFDILHILFFKRKQNITKEIIVFPVIKKLNYALSSVTSGGEDATTAYQEGQDNSEIFDIRKYHQGDTLRHIHWKLSMKKNELLVKTGSQLLQEEIMITYVVNANNTINDQTLDILHTLCISLNISKDNYTMGIYDFKSNSISKYSITNEDEYHQVLFKILLSLKDPYTKEQLVASCLNQSVYIIDKDQMIIVDDDGGMKYEKISLSS